MRSHGWQPPFHPLQTVAIVVFSALAFSFYVFFAPFLGTRALKFIIIGVFTPLVAAVFALYAACTWLDPADPGVHRAQQKFHPVKPATPAAAAAPYGQPREDTKIQSLKAFLATHKEEDGYEPIADTGCQPLTDKLAEKSCCKRKREDDADDAHERSLYCSICDAEISMHSKHCRACDKCVHGFDHHCRWLNNCVGSRNYKPFIALMVSCLLMLVLEWAVGIVVLVRCFGDKTAFQDEIVDNLGRSFPRAAFIVVLVCLTFLALLATAPLTQLFCFHLILMHKGISTYDYILAVREQNQEYWDEAGGLSGATTTPASSTETGFSGYNSSGAAMAGKRIVFCTPPRMFVDQDQTILALSDLEIGSGKPGAGKILDAKSSQQQRPAPVGINPWKLARVRTSDAASAAARARQKSSILLPSRPGPGGVLTLSTDSSESSSFAGSSLSTSGEIRVAASVPRKKFRRPGLRRELWSLTKSKRDRITPLSDEDMFAPRGASLFPLAQEPRSPYRSRSSSFSSDPRASFPPKASPFPPQVLFPRYPGDDEKASSFYPTSSPNPDGDPTTRESVNSARGGAPLRASANSDGYEASCGSGDDGSEVVGVSQSWTKASWSKLEMEKVEHEKTTETETETQTQTPESGAAVWGKEENVKPWVIFSAGTEKQDAKESPGWQSVSSGGSRVEANILKANPSLRTARLFSPTALQQSPPLELRESSDFLSEDTTSCCETPDRGTMSSFFYNGPLDVSFKATSERRLLSNKRLMESILGSRIEMVRATDDPKLLVETP